MDIYPNLPESDLFSRAVLSDNRFVRMVGRRCDLNFAIIRYRLFFIYEDIDNILSKISHVSKQKFSPIIKAHVIPIVESHVLPVVQSQMIQNLQYRLMRLILLSEKLERFLERKLPRKTRLTLLTLLFCLSFGFLFLSSFGFLPKNYALTRLRHSHSNFRKYAFIAIERDSYINGLIIVNTALYIIQGACLMRIITPSTSFKRGLDSATLGSTLALTTQIKLSDKITNSRFGPLVENIQRPQISLPLSTLFALGCYVSSQTMAASNGNIGTNQLFLNEVEIFNQIRKNILTLPNETKYKMEYLARKYYAEGLYPLSQMGCGSLRLNQSVPFDESKYLRCVHYVYRNYCQYTPACKEFGKEVLSVIETLVDKKNLSFGGASNLYNAPEIKAVSVINLFAFNKKPWETGFAEITENYQLYNWLRGVKFLMENSSDLNL